MKALRFRSPLDFSHPRSIEFRNTTLCLSAYAAYRRLYNWL
nr:MAG TPA: hypothetical protein [Bacteriophage sp.]DAL94113.1 MAG TPA: hypothetical protein [Caudoviricetes sp.]DAZ48258.1 MAG TPA: hypothetical protein [Caudoviricetes sp.]